MVCSLTQKAQAALSRKLLRIQRIKPTRIVTYRLASYGTALKLSGLKHPQDAAILSPETHFENLSNRRKTNGTSRRQRLVPKKAIKSN